MKEKHKERKVTKKQDSIKCKLTKKPSEIIQFLTFSGKPARRSPV